MKFYLGNGNSIRIYSEFSVKYCTQIRVKPKQRINSFSLQKIVELIGAKHKDSVNGDNGKRHKGIKVIIEHCKKKHGVIVTKTEIKKLFYSLTRIQNNENVEIISCPYLISQILKSIIELSRELDDIQNTIESFANYVNNIDCVTLYIPDYYRLLESFLDGINQARMNSTIVTIPDWQYERLASAKGGLEEFFESSCYQF